MSEGARLGASRRSNIGRVAGAALVTALLGVAAEAKAQVPPQEPPPPPPGFQPVQPPPPGYAPPPGYGPAPGYGPPPGYAPPPGYGPPPGYAPPPGYGPAPAKTEPGPRVLPHDEGEPIPPGYHADTRIRKGLVIGGSVTFGVMYLITAFTGALLDSADEATSNTNMFVPLYVPAVGPFIAIGTTGATAGGAFFLALDGVVQCGGLAMGIAGIAAPQSIIVRDDVVAKPSFKVTPMALGQGGMGLGIVGRM